MFWAIQELVGPDEHAIVTVPNYQSMETLPGLRIGWLACRDRALLERLERRTHYTSICNAVPSGRLATIALRNGGGGSESATAT